MECFPPRVLVLEDDEQLRELLAEILIGDNIKVDSVGDGLTALAKIEATDFDLIITDIDLPGEVDGLETVRRARIRHPCLCSLFISGKGMPAMDDPDIDDFVAKPFCLIELLGCVWELLLRKTPRHDADNATRSAERCLASRPQEIDCLRPDRRVA